MSEGIIKQQYPKNKKNHPSSMLKEAPVLPALMVKVLHSQSVSVDNLPSCSKGSSKMMSDIQKLEVKKKISTHYTSILFLEGIP